MGILAAGEAEAAAAAAAMFGDDDERAKNEDEHGYDLVMPGFRFHPTEEELIEFYLRRKVEGRRFNVDLINYLDLYRYDPWELPAMATIGEKEWYFYVPRDRKYRNGDRPNRVTTSGYWKATGADRVIRSENQLRSIGLKKTLVFYAGKAPKGIRTSWIMNEYRLPHSETLQYQIRTEISLCRVHKRSGVEDNSQNIAGTLLASTCRPSSSARATADHKKHSSFAASSSSSRRQPSSAMEMIMKFPKPSSAAINGGALSIYGGGGGGGSSAASIASLSSTTSMEEDSHGHPMKNTTMNHLTAAAAASAITDYYSAAAAAASAAAPGIEDLVSFNMSQISPPLNQHTMSLPMISEKLWEWWNPLPEVGN